MDRKSLEESTVRTSPTHHNKALSTRTTAITNALSMYPSTLHTRPALLPTPPSPTALTDVLTNLHHTHLITNTHLLC